MLRIAKWLFIFVVLTGVPVALAVQFVLANNDLILVDRVSKVEAVPQFVLIWDYLGYELQRPLPVGLLVLFVFLAGLFSGFLISLVAGAGLEMRILKFRRQVRSLRREVESLRVSDLDEDLERELSDNELGLDDEDDTRYGTPPVSSGAASTYDDEGDTRVSYSGLMPSGDLEDSGELSTRKSVDVE
jgi:hypothetical protein